MTEHLAVIVLALFLSGAGFLLYSRGGSSKGAASDEGRLRTGNEYSSAAPGKVLILTAAVGGGHEAAGRTVRAELEGAGSSVAMTDGLRIMSRALSWSLNPSP